MSHTHSTRKNALLLLQTEFLDKRIVTTLVRSLKVAEVRAAVGNHLEKAAAGMKILRIFLQMLGELVYLLGKERDLHIGRSGVRAVPGGAFHNRHLFLSGKHVYFYPTMPCGNAQVLRDEFLTSWPFRRHGN